MPIDLEAARLEEAMWSCTAQLRWHRPKGGNDTDIMLEQLWERVTGERSWRKVPLLMED